MKKKMKKSIFDRYFDLFDLIFDPKNTRLVEIKFFLVTFVKNLSFNNYKKNNWKKIIRSGVDWFLVGWWTSFF